MRPGMIRFLFLIAAMLPGGALAADAVSEPPAPLPAPLAESGPSGFWSGGYAGVFVGAGFGESASDTAGLDGLSTDGGEGGVFAGYNWQAGNFVYGVEGDFGYARPGDAEGAQGAAEKELFGSLRARAGVALDPVMIYGTAGVAGANFETFSLDDSDENTHVGFTVGAGAEAAITPNLTGRLEYRFTDYGSADYNLNGTVVSSGFDEHSVRAGIALKF